MHHFKDDLIDASLYPSVFQQLGRLRRQWFTASQRRVDLDQSGVHLKPLEHGAEAAGILLRHAAQERHERIVILSVDLRQRGRAAFYVHHLDAGALARSLVLARSDCDPLCRREIASIHRVEPHGRREDGGSHHLPLLFVDTSIVYVRGARSRL